jgi:hypothetical protein
MKEGKWNHFQCKYQSLVPPWKQYYQLVFLFNSNYDRTIDVFSFEADSVHVHYEILLREKYSDILN